LYFFGNITGSEATYGKCKIVWVIKQTFPAYLISTLSPERYLVSNKDYKIETIKRLSTVIAGTQDLK
jgi:hypothetical protein